MSDAEILDGYSTNVLHVREVPEKQAKYITVVNNKEETLWELNISPQIKLALKVFYSDKKEDVCHYELIKLKKGIEQEKVTLSKFGLEKIKEFNGLLESIDLQTATNQKIALNKDVNLDSVISALHSENGEQILEAIRHDPYLKEDIIAIAHKKEQLEIFRKMLENESYWKTYSKDIGKTKTTEEKTWQEFFCRNQWIFGYGLEYQFKGILQKEFHASDTNIDGKNAVIGDFLLADKKFVTFVEIKTPNTKLLTKTKNRSNSWSLSSDLIHAVSQILEQKASGQIKLAGKELYDENGAPIKQQSVDSKTILLVGNWSEIKESNEQLTKIKERTFELFRRDSRNIEIFTYDELYNRAKCIVENISKKEQKEN